MGESSDRRKLRYSFPVVVLLAAMVAVPGLVAVPRATASATTPTGLTSAAALAAPGPAQDWPTFLQNDTRTAATTDPNMSAATASALKLDWSAATGGPIATSPTIVGTTAYVGSWDGFEYAFDTTTGALKWKRNLGQTNAPKSRSTDDRGHLVGDGQQWCSLRRWRRRLLVRARPGERCCSVADLHRRQLCGRRGLQLVEPADRQWLRVHRSCEQLRQPVGAGPPHEGGHHHSPTRR